MKYLKTYDSYLFENFDHQLLLENKIFNVYKSAQDRTISKLSLNLYFAATYTWGVTMLYPIVDALTKNSDVPNITTEQIVLLTLFSITQILNMVNNDVKKIKAELEKDGILSLAEKVKTSLLSVHNIFSFVSRSFGRAIDSFIDMVAYVGLGLPFTTAIVELISKEGLNLDTLPQKAMVLGAAAGIYGVKSIVETIIELIKNKMRK